MSALRLVIFDCDGVLTDSEGPSNALVAEELSALGWTMSAAEATTLFAGTRLSDMVPLIEARLGRAVDPAWPELVCDRLIARLGEEVETMDGAHEVLRATAALGLPYRIASNSSHEEMVVKFARTGLAPLVEGRVHSARDVGVGKPAPDLFLAAAAAEGVAPASCIVVEDSPPGVRAAVAAGMRCIALAPHGDGALVRALGAEVVRHLSELPAIFRAAMRLPVGVA